VIYYYVNKATHKMIKIERDINLKHYYEFKLKYRLYLKNKVVLGIDIIFIKRFLM